MLLLFCIEVKSTPFGMAFFKLSKMETRSPQYHLAILGHRSRLTPVADVEQGLNGATLFQPTMSRGVLLQGWLCLLVPACGGCSLAVHMPLL